MFKKTLFCSIRKYIIFSLDLPDVMSGLRLLKSPLTENKSHHLRRFSLLLMILCCYSFSYASDASLKQADNYYKEGLKAHKSKKYDLAKTGYQKALILGLKDIKSKKTAFNNLGVIYAQENNLIKAEESLIEALKLDPAYRAAKLNLGLVYDLGGDRAESLAYWLEVLDLNKLKPKEFIKYNTSGKSAFKECKDKICQKVALNNEAVDYAQKGQVKKAEQLFKTALTIDPDSEIAKMNLGLIYDKQKGEMENLDYWMDVFNLSVEVIKPKDFILEK